MRLGSAPFAQVGRRTVQRDLNARGHASKMSAKGREFLSHLLRQQIVLLNIRNLPYFVYSSMAQRQTSFESGSQRLSYPKLPQLGIPPLYRTPAIPAAMTTVIAHKRIFSGNGRGVHFHNRPHLTVCEQSDAFEKRSMLRFACHRCHKNYDQLA